MATKTITLEIDAYEKLKRAKRPGESFTEVVRRADFKEAPVTGATLLAHYQKSGGGVSDKYLDAVEAAAGLDRPPDDPWS